MSAVRPGLKVICADKTQMQTEVNILFYLGGEDDCCQCCDCECCDGRFCGCVENTCGDTCASILKLPIKFLLLILFLLLMIFVFAFRDLLAIIGMFIISILAGMFGLSFEFLCSHSDNTLLFIFMIIFFPICMIVGIGSAFSEIFCEVVSNNCN